MTPADPALETPVAAPVLPGPVGRWLRSHPRAADSGLALFIFLLGSLSTVLQAQNPVAFQAIGVPGLVILALAQTTAGTALALRRIRPLATWAAVILVMPVTEILTVLVLEESAPLYVSSMLMLTLLIGMPLMLGTLTVRVRTRWAWLAWVASTLAVQVPQMVLERYTFVESAMTLMVLALVNMIGVLVGLNARSQRQRLAEVEARSARASLEREQTALLAAANERSRIAREMHDVVAHSLAVMITMADGVAATIDRNPEMAKEALGMLAETGRSALADTRRLVGVLRDDPGATSAPAGHPGAAGVGSGGAAGTFPGPAAAEAVGTTPAPAGPCTPGPAGKTTRAQIGTAMLNAASSGPVGEATGSPSGLSPTGAHNGPGSQAAVPGRTLQATGPGAHDGPLPGPTGVPAGTTTPASGSPGPDRPLPVPAPREPETRAVPLPEFAPPGTVPPVEPSQAVAHLRTQATDVDPSTGDTPLSPAPEQSDLPVLIRRFQAAGVPVDYTWEGRALPGDKGLQLTLYRIAQESLTNILRYAPTTPRVTVRVERHTGTVVLTVENLSAPGSRPVHGSGKGLIGMRERAAVYGGTVQAGPTRTGWQVRAVLRWEENDEGSPSWQIPH
ncbi:histidine kinase [uncultured Actinomyces sp.]|uniref:ATP-binding protein n=1 Tax=uncultured Actinomyces sp. TaxID=249061 RepID=UPI0026120E65|nr:histidine kinase [uncultured Actinomyces sp.]